MKYTTEALAKINSRFLGTHYTFAEKDLDMVNKLVDEIEKSRTRETPMPGDSVRFTSEYGEYFPEAHIEYLTDDGYANICECASSYANGGTSFSSSGGTWHFIPLKEMKYVGTMEKKFWHFGYGRVCADGGIDFCATVNVWEYSENKEKYTTETHDRYYLSHSDTYDDNYHFFIERPGQMGGAAFRTEDELQAWLRTFRAEVKDRGKINADFVWTYKNEMCQVSPDEFESIDGIEDTMLFNGSIRKCKRVYDDANTTIHTYFVWYWDDPSEESFEEKAMKQNKIREENYTLDWRKHTENEYAKMELETGKVKPIKLTY